MPSFCRHNRLVQNCTICSRELNVAVRPIVSGGASTRERSSEPREHSERTAKPRTARVPKSVTRAGGNEVKVRRMARGADDGFHSILVPGLKSSQDAERLAQEIAFATERLRVMELVATGETHPDADPAWSEIAGPGELEDRTRMAFEYVVTGPRGLGSGDRAEGTRAAYDAWVGRSGSQQKAFTGESFWTPERRFERLFERLSLPGMTRDTRFELLTTLGRLGLYESRPGTLQLSGENEATWAAKRALGIGDPLLLDRRAIELASASKVPLEALDLAFDNWGSGKRIGGGLAEDAEVDEQVLAQALHALGL
jgi:hypothetical protein